MPSTRFHIDKPCRENWEAMSPTERGRHCAACSKEVIDFTRYSEQEMMDYFSSRKGEQVCGRMELKTDFPQFIIRPKNEYKPYGYWMTLSLAALLLAGCSQKSANIAPSSIFPSNPIIRLDTNLIYTYSLKLDKVRTLPAPKKVKPKREEPKPVKINDSTYAIIQIMGNYTYFEPNECDQQTINPIIEHYSIQTDFINPGLKTTSLDKFIQDQAFYPRREKELGISGRVIVQFTLTKDGHIQNPIVIDAPENALGLELEAMRLTKTIKGLEPLIDIYGNQIDAVLSIPFLFELK